MLEQSGMGRHYLDNGDITLATSEDNWKRIVDIKAAAKKFKNQTQLPFYQQLDAIFRGTVASGSLSCNAPVREIGHRNNTLLGAV